MATIRDVEPDLNYQQPFNSLEKRELESWFQRNGPGITRGENIWNLDDRVEMDAWIIIKAIVWGVILAVCAWTVITVAFIVL